MRKISLKNYPPVSVVIVHRNSSSTILHTLNGLLKQTYPIREVIIVDNRSTDDSLEIIKKFSKSHKSLGIRFIYQTENRGVGNSYNKGVRAAKSNHVIIMQADGVLPTKNEITSIMKPVLESKKDTIVATTPYTLMPMYVWKNYNFWEKCLVATAVEKNSEGFNGKFDYVNKKLYFKAGGFDDKNFYAGVGGEDADLTMRMQKVGKIVRTKAKVVHLHYIGKDYFLKDWILNRKLYARSYGKIFQLHGLSLPFDTWILWIKPVLAFLSLIPFFYPYSFLSLFIFAFFNMERMYRTPSTLKDPRILLLPFITVGLVYYEAFWMIEAFFFAKKKEYTE